MLVSVPLTPLSTFLDRWIFGEILCKFLPASQVGQCIIKKDKDKDKDNDMDKDKDMDNYRDKFKDKDRSLQQAQLIKTQQDP